MLLIAGWAVAIAVVAGAGEPPPPLAENGIYHVYPGQNIQVALDRAAQDSVAKVVRVHAGTYRPLAKGQALIGLNAKHDGITLEAAGEVILTAANAEVAARSSKSFPAVVNHVVYFGDGISRATVLRGFKITGGNQFVTDQPSEPPLEPHFDQLRSTEGFYGHLFFYTDGAAIKVFGRCYPTIDHVEIHDNYASPCAGGISIEHRGFKQSSVLIENCTFRTNRCLVTGSAVDLLPGSAAEIRNCLFVGNISNTGTQYSPVEGNIDWPEIRHLVETTLDYQPEHGSGALTVFPGSTVLVDHCTFTGNFNGVDDKGSKSIYRNSIFWMNVAKGGVRSGARYELDVLSGTIVSDCFIRGEVNALRKNIDSKTNHLDCSDPVFDSEYRPTHPAFSEAGYRPKP